jgi:hypothetical protein
MANAARGETTLEIGERTLTLVLTTNSICEVESLLKTRIGEIIKVFESGSPSFEFIRALFWGSLRKHHRGFSIEKAGELIDEAGIAKIGTAIGEAMQLAFSVEEVGVDPNPQKAE